MALSPAAPGIDRPLIGRVVHRFYDLVRRDPDLGPIFAGRVTDWAAHEERLIDFWSSLLLWSGAYKGSPMEVHLAIPGLAPAHFARWLSLFRIAVSDRCTAEQAAAFVVRAERIAVAFQSARAPRPTPASAPLPS